MAINKFHYWQKSLKRVKYSKLFKENNIIFDNYKDIAEGFDNFFINIGHKLQQKLLNPIKSITDYLGNKVPSNFVFNFVGDRDIL